MAETQSPQETNATGIWTLDELLDHASENPEKVESRRSVVREGRLAADDEHRRALIENAAPAQPATAGDVQRMSDESFARMRRTQRRGGFQW